MRRLALPLALSFAFLAGCSSTPVGNFLPDGSVDMGRLSFILTGVREGVIRFLDAYANQGKDDGRSLVLAVDSADLHEYVRTIRALLAGLSGPLQGTLHDRGFQIVDLKTLPDGRQGWVVDLRASVDFSYRPAVGSPSSFSVSFDGPMTLAATRGADWLVVDATVDGQSLQDSILRYRAVRDVAGVQVGVASIFRFHTGWQVNVIVRNATNGKISLVPDVTELRVGSVAEPIRGVTVGLRAPIPPGAQLAEALTFPPGSTTARRLFVQIVFKNAAGEAVALRFPLILREAPSPTPSPSSPAPPTASPTASALAARVPN